MPDYTEPFNVDWETAAVINKLAGYFECSEEEVITRCVRVAARHVGVMPAIQDPIMLKARLYHPENEMTFNLSPRVSRALHDIAAKSRSGLDLSSYVNIAILELAKQMGIPVDGPGKP